jgi:hypothetical protein
MGLLYITRSGCREREGLALADFLLTASLSLFFLLSSLSLPSSLLLLSFFFHLLFFSGDERHTAAHQPLCETLAFSSTLLSLLLLFFLLVFARLRL